MVDEASESTQLTSPQVSESPSITADPDLRPVGRCYVEAMAVQSALIALKTAQENLRKAVLAFGDCRAETKEEAGDYAAANNTSFEDAVEAAMLKIAVNASIVEDIVTQAYGDCSDCSDCSEDSNE
jgi:delta-aminolevulinic acid dehydratase/porphobilinogen synthase